MPGESLSLSPTGLPNYAPISPCLEGQWTDGMAKRRYLSRRFAVSDLAQHFQLKRLLVRELLQGPDLGFVFLHELV